jgi:hypothetical protein
MNNKVESKYNIPFVLTNPYGNQTPPIPHTSLMHPQTLWKTQNANPKMKTMEKKVEACPFIRNTLGVRNTC